tara:strand:- start:140 stop:1423 length:1284 start_codon:yes stop_codon:yes gene_type:complete
MPVQSCSSNGSSGFKWGESGKCYTYTSGDEQGKARAKAKAGKQGAAVEAQGYGMDEEDERDPIKLGYWVDLRGAEFSDTSWIQAVPVGTYQHPSYGEIDFTPDKISNMALNVKNEVRDTQLDVDYDHKSRTGKAAGWIMDAQARPDGLYLQVEWTDTATEAIKNKEYKYFSPEYQDKWKHPKTGTVFKDVLFGGALTNRPFLKDLVPVNLSELIGDQGEPIMADDTFVTSMRDILGLDGEASEEALLSAAEQLVVQNETEAVTSEVPESSPDSIPELVTASEETTEMVALTETYPEVKALVDRVALLEVANRLSEVNLKMSEWDNARPYTIPSVLRDRARKLLTEARSIELEEFINELTQHGMVPLGETESATRGIDRSASDTFQQMVDKKLSEDPSTDYVDAVSEVSRDNPDLFEEYRREAFQEVN